MIVLDPTILTGIKQGWLAYSTEDGSAYLITADGAIPVSGDRVSTELDDGLLVPMGADWFRMSDGEIAWTKPASPVAVGNNGFEGRMSGYHFGGIGTYLAGPTGMNRIAGSIGGVTIDQTDITIDSTLITIDQVWGD